MITPCVSICTIDSDTGLCIGCRRTAEEIRDWLSYTSEQRLEVMRRLGYGTRKGGRSFQALYEKG